jgi:hypothetical protein
MAGGASGWCFVQGVAVRARDRHAVPRPARYLTHGSGLCRTVRSVMAGCMPHGCMISALHKSACYNARPIDYSWAIDLAL